MSFADDSLRRRVFVFGGTSGINLGIAKSFAASGAIVAVASRNPSKVDAAVGALNELGAEALGFALDVREPEAGGRHGRKRRRLESWPLAYRTLTARPQSRRLP